MALGHVGTFQTLQTQRLVLRRRAAAATRLARSRRPGAVVAVVTAAAAGVPVQLLGTVAALAAAGPRHLALGGLLPSGVIDPQVLAATLNASTKLFIICAAVGWLLRSGRLPNSTATVLSQVGVGEGARFQQPARS